VPFASLPCAGLNTNAKSHARAVARGASRDLPSHSTLTIQSPADWRIGEDAIDLAAVPQHLPPKPNGERISLATVRRWRRVGLHGVRLRTFPIGGRRSGTTVEELHRFLNAIASMRGEETAL